MLAGSLRSQETLLFILHCEPEEILQVPPFLHGGTILQTSTLSGWYCESQRDDAAFFCMKGYISEVFTSIQGEGIRVGRRQTFIRFLGCNLSCNYCDTPNTQKMEGLFVYAGKVSPNPVELDFLLDKLDADEISITGGEPLLQIEFLDGLCKKIRQMKKDICIDTNGTLPDELKKVIHHMNTVSLDFKIPTATGRPKLWDEHEKCLRIAASKRVFVKIVINENVLPQELDKACEIIKKADKNIPLIIQPVFERAIPNILDLQKTALKQLNDVRIIPQVHKYLGLI